MTDLILALVADLWALMLAIAAAVGFVWLERRRARAQGAADERAARNAETLDRISAGQEAAAKAASSGKTSEQILRDNDGRWQ